MQSTIDKRKKYYSKNAITKLRETRQELYKERQEALIELNKSHKKDERFTKLSILAIKLVPIIAIGLSIWAYFNLSTIAFLIILFISIIVLIGIIIYAFLFALATGVSDNVGSIDYEYINQIDRKINRINSKIEKLKKELEDPSSL